MTPESVVCWRWTPHAGYRSTYGPETVNTLRGMVARNFARPHRFICVTDDAEGIDPRVEVVPAWNDFADLLSPHGAKNPACYRRLRMFHPEIENVFGRRFVSLDLDMVLTGDVTGLWDRPEDIVLYGDTNPQPGSHYNGSMVLMTAGSRPFIWSEFDPIDSPRLATRAKCWGSDQGWLSYRLGPNEGKFKRADGVYSFRNDLNSGASPLPTDAKVVVMHGAFDPWNARCQRLAWVQSHYHAGDRVAA